MWAALIRGRHGALRCARSGMLSRNSSREVSAGTQASLSEAALINAA
jgi:hypothetical protein